MCTSECEKLVEVSDGSDMSFYTSHTLPGGYVAKGVGMRDLGYGKIKITGIPEGAVVEQALLYWVVLNTSETAAMASGVFTPPGEAGTSIEGALVSTCAEPCWSAGLTYVYRSDVTQLMKGNGVYHLSDFASGLTTGGDPWTNTVTLPLAEGATLVVIYRDSDSPVKTIVINEGCHFFQGNSVYEFNITGFVADPVSSATLTVFGADGQIGPGTNSKGEKDGRIATPDYNKEFLTFNGKVIGSNALHNAAWNGSTASSLPPTLGHPHL